MIISSHSFMGLDNEGLVMVNYYFKFSESMTASEMFLAVKI